MLRFPASPATAPRLLLLLLAAAAGVARGGYAPPTKYLIVSNARNGSIGYMQLSRSGSASEVRTLIDKDLVHPQGLAVDQKRQLLLIADSELRKVVSYGLMVHEDGTLGVDEQTPVAEDVSSRWVAVDGPGNVFFTDEENGKVMRISARQLLDGDTKASSVFSSDAKGDSILSPGGVATDNFHVFWTNKQSGKEVGTVMKALHGPPVSNTSGGAAALNSEALAKNVPKAYGLCLAMGKLYYTDAEKKVYAVATKGDGQAVTVTSELANPRGCAWDGEATVYVADRSADGVFAIPGPALVLTEVKATKVASFDGAFGIAVFSSARPGAWMPSLAGLLLLLTALPLAASSRL